MRSDIAWTILLVAFASAARAQPAPRRIVLLHSYDRNFAPFDTFAENFRAQVPGHMSEHVQFFDVSLQPARFWEATDPRPIIEYVRAMFAGRPLDLLVPIGGPAVRFAQQHRQELFPSTPMLMAAADHRLVQADTLTAQDAVVAVANDPSQVIDGIVRVLPQTTHIFVVIGTSRHEGFWREELHRQFQRFAGRLTFDWSDGLSFAEMLARSADLPPHSAIFYALWSVDGKGILQPDDQALSQLHTVANAPIFGAFSTQLGRGIVGGPLMAIDELSRNAAAVAVRILHGAPPGTIRTPTQVPGLPMYDWRELRRWEIAESALPQGSVVRYHEPGAWGRYKWPILGGASLSVVQTLLIVALVVNRRRRRHTETTLARLSRTLMKAQEDERASIARELHDDLCQRMVALSLEIYQLAPDGSDESADRVRDVGQKVGNLAGAIQALSQRLHSSSLELLGLGSVVAAACRELASELKVEIDFHQDGSADGLPNHVALEMLRVLEEALHNAAQHSGVRHIVVRLEGHADEVVLIVIDSGIGFHVDTAMRSGVGLVAMQERMNLVNGRISLQSYPGVGTTVRACVPR